MLKIKDRYMYLNDKPFFYLADTAWLIANKLNIDEIEIYFKNRNSLGYNTIQMILFHNIGLCNNIDDYIKYLNYVNEIISLANKYNLFIALLPCWGSLVKDGIINLNNYKLLADCVIKYFSHHKNLIWVIGGDILGDYNLELFNSLAIEIKNKDKYHLMSFHPFGRTTSTRWFSNSDWIDFHMFQSGHRRYDQIKMKENEKAPEIWYGEDSYKYVIESFNSSNKPSLDAEPSYEGVCQGLHNFNEPFWQSYDVRRYAYWSVFQGACGFCYGNGAIIQFHNSNDGVGDYGVTKDWHDALYDKGGSQLRYLKELMESVDYVNGKFNDDILATPQKEKYERISIFSGDDFIFVYDYLGKCFKLNLEKYKFEMDCYWMNPENGEYIYFDTILNENIKEFKPIFRNEIENDWVLVLKRK